MIYAENNSIEALIMHRIGNKGMDEGYTISDKCIHLDSQLAMLLTKYFIGPFISGVFYNLYHEASLELNEIYNYATKIFNDFSLFHEQSINIAKHLYNESSHPKIKAGELYIAYFHDCIVDGKNMDAIGIFKSIIECTVTHVRYPQGWISDDGCFSQRQAPMEIHPMIYISKKL